MLSAAERKRILAMIESGRLSPEEGMELLESFRQAPGGEAAASPPRAGRRLRLRITDAATGQVIASARLPLSAVRLLQQAIGRFVPDLDLVDLSDWLDEAEDGEGRILDLLEREDGQRVEIFVE